MTITPTSNVTQLIIILMIGLIINNQSTAESLLIRDVTIVSPKQSFPANKPQNVLLKDGRIAAIGQKLYRADRQLQGKNRFLIPGLIDSHVHLEGIPGAIPSNMPSEKSIIDQTHAQIPKSYLYFGFTTVLDLASFSGAIKAWNRQSLRPDAHYCIGVPIPNGYPLAWDRENQFNTQMSKFFLYDKRQAHVVPKHINPKNHTAKTLAKRIKDDGALCIKVYYETGFGPLKNLPVPTKEMVDSITKEAHKLGLRVFMHGNSEKAYRFGMNTDIDVMAHGMWHWDKLTLSAEDELQSFVKTALNSKVAFQPTIQVIYGEQQLFKPNFFNEENVKHAIPSGLIAWYHSEPGQWMKNKIKSFMRKAINDPLEQYQYVVENYKDPIERLAKFTQILAKSNVPLIFGSDTPSGPFYSQFPGVNGHLEIQRWSEAGISLEKIFNALTIDNAKYIGLDDKIGSIEIGKSANLLLLNKNPLKTIEAYDSINTVILHGKPIKRDDLSALRLSK